MIPEGYCHCGCGERTKRAPQSDNKRGYVKGEFYRYVSGHVHRGSHMPCRGYRVVRVPGHPAAKSNGCVYLHVVIAESALGHHLPDGAEVHHVDGNHLNNAPSNLVICQDRAYHKLLHFRTRIVRRGGDPNSQRLCGACDRVLPFDAFRKEKRGVNGFATRCKECMRAYELRFKKTAVA